jgi:3-oxoacyl-[acyl-carrier-protein] synthase II
MTRRRVVVTGLGLISPVGNTVAEGWANLVAGKSGIANITKFDASNFACRFAGEVKGFNVEEYFPAKEARHMDTFIHYGLAASMQAVRDAGLPTNDALSEEQAERIGVLVGSGIGGLPLIEDTHAELAARGPRRVSPFFVPASIINMISGHVSIKYGFQGPNLAIVTACTTGLHCIGEAGRLIEYGDADVMIAGGSESTVSPLGVGGFAAARALSTRNDDPATASRPWDKDRDGFVLGEGAWMIVLEREDRARARGATIYASVDGYASTCDAYHRVQMAPDGDEIVRAMTLAIARSGRAADEIGYVNFHGTSTILNDAVESRCVRQLFGRHADRLAGSSVKSMIGHPQGASGAAGVVTAALAMSRGFLPPTINQRESDPACDLDVIPNQGRATDVEAALCNCLGFGSKNSAIVVGRA